MDNKKKVLLQYSRISLSHTKNLSKFSHVGHSILESEIL